MWISRKHHEHLFATLAAERERVVVLTERVVQLERQYGGHVSTIEWLRQHVNRLEVERGILTQRILQTPLPIPELAREPVPTPEGQPLVRDEDAPPGERLAGMPVAPVIHGVPEDSIAASQLAGLSFEDMGDDAAGRLGVQHDAAGQVVYTK